MTTQKTIKSKFKVSTILTYIIGGIAMLLLCIYLVKSSLNSEYPQIIGLILGGFFGLIGLICLLGILSFETLELDHEKLIVKSILQFHKKTIYFRDIISYNEIEKVNKSGKWFDLTIYTPKENCKISSSVISNYYQFKQILTKGKPKNTNSDKLWEYKKTKYFGLALVIVGSLFLYGFWNIYSNREKIILPQQLSTIKVTVSNELEIERRKSSKWINIKAKEFPKFVFELAGNNFHAANSQQLIANVSKGDMIEIDILTDTYEKKIVKNKPLTFWDKTINYNFISICGLRDSNQAYLTLHNLNNENKSDSASWAFWLFVIIALGTSSSGIYLLNKNKKPAANSAQPTVGL